jgi:hypothetical protein
MRSVLAALSLLCAGLSVRSPGAGADEGEKLRLIIRDQHAEGTDLWIYNDLAQAKAEARRCGRPIFVTFRCVPCKACSGFEFDYDLNWAAMFINADGTVYARYGTQSAAGPDAYNSIEGLERTMRRVLELHEAYPRNASETWVS